MKGREGEKRQFPAIFSCKLSVAGFSTGNGDEGDRQGGYGQICTTIHATS